MSRLAASSGVVTVLHADRLLAAGFRHGFPLRYVSDEALLEALGSDRVIQVNQVHGGRAVLAGAGAGGRVEADALVAREAGQAVGVRVADCVPVLIADEASGAVAAIHAGWRGVVAGVVRAGVELLGGRPAAMVAAIGPCIGACCFEVGADVAREIGFVDRWHDGKAYVDLRAAVRAQLRALGLDDARVEDVAGCTKHEPQRFHSFRRDGPNSGRMLGAIRART
jgi:YfiH family protein